MDGRGRSRDSDRQAGSTTQGGSKIIVERFGGPDRENSCNLTRLFQSFRLILCSTVKLLTNLVDTRVFPILS